MQTVSQVMQKKDRRVWSVSPDATLFEALQLMSDKNVGVLLVLEDGGLVGIFSERDFARHAIRPDISIHTTRVGELMTEHVFTVRLGQTIGACMALMTEKGVRHLPVMDGKKVVGVISIGDVVRAIIAEQQQVINELGSYISGDRKDGSNG